MAAATGVRMRTATIRPNIVSGKARVSAPACGVVIAVIRDLAKRIDTIWMHLSIMLALVSVAVVTSGRSAAGSGTIISVLTPRFGVAGPFPAAHSERRLGGARPLAELASA